MHKVPIVKCISMNVRFCEMKWQHTLVSSSDLKACFRSASPWSVWRTLAGKNIGGNSGYGILVESDRSPRRATSSGAFGFMAILPITSGEILKIVDAFVLIAWTLVLLWRKTKSWNWEHSVLISYWRLTICELYVPSCQLWQDCSQCVRVKRLVTFP